MATIVKILNFVILMLLVEFFVVIEQFYQEYQQLIHL